MHVAAGYPDPHVELRPAAVLGGVVQGFLENSIQTQRNVGTEISGNSSLSNVISMPCWPANSLQKERMLAAAPRIATFDECSSCDSI